MRFRHSSDKLGTAMTGPCASADASSDCAAAVDFDRLRAHTTSLSNELRWIDEALRDARALHGALRGRRFVYVGGRPASNAALRQMVRDAGGDFTHHTALVDDDGGMGARQLAIMLAHAHCVLCPLDTIDPDSLRALRRICARHRVPWMPLRTSNVSSFLAAVMRAQSQPTRQHVATHARCCVRHD